MAYDYDGALREDIRNWLEQNVDGFVPDSEADGILTELRTLKSVVGSDEDGYTGIDMIYWEDAMPNGNLKLLAEAFRFFNFTVDEVLEMLGGDWEAIDHFLRRYTLEQVFGEVVEEWNWEHPKGVSDGINGSEEGY